MKKHLLKTLLMGVMTLIATGAWAADPDLTNDYTLVKSAEWGDGTNIAGTGACAHTAYDTGNKKQQSLTILTAPEAAADWIAMQAWTDVSSGKGWWNRADNGLYCVNAGRSACVFGDDLTTGWLVVFECTTSASSVMTLTNGAGDPDGTFSYVASEDGQKYFCTITAAENAYVGFCGNKNAGFISKISVYKPNKAVVLTTYTVNYVDMDGNTLKESVTYDAIGGAAIALSDADKANITVGDDTYVYDSDDTEGKTVAEDGSSVVTVKFHKAQNFNYIVNEMCGGTAARVTKSFSYETATVTAPYRKFNAVDGQLYTKGATNKEYNYRFTLTQDNQVEKIDYSAVEGVDNVVFLTEGEDVEGLTPCNSTNTGIRSSNSASAYAAADTKIVTLSPGTYKLHAIIYDASKTPDSHWIFKAGETQIADFNCTTVNIQEFDSEEFTLTENTDIIMAAAGSNTMGLDALYITGTGSSIAVTKKTISLIPGPWSVDGAIFSAYAWNDEGSAWFPFVSVSGTGIYATQIPDTFTGVLIARINPAGTDENPWNNVWNQTEDIDFTTIADQTVFSITGWGEGEGAKSTYTAATPVEAAKAILQRFVNVAKGLEIDTTDAEALLANDEATIEQLNAGIQALLVSLQQKATEIVAMVKAFFDQFDNAAAAALTPYFAAAEEALAGGDYNAMRVTTTALAAKCLEEGKNAMEKVDSYLRKMGNETINADLDAIKAAIESASDPNDILKYIPLIQKLKEDMTPAAMTYLGVVATLISEGTAAGKDVSAMQTAYNNVMTVAMKYNAGTATIVEMGFALYNLIKAVEAYNVEGIIPDGTYYVMSANEGTLINAESALDAKGAPITFTFSNNAYTIEGADYFTGKQWTVANAIEGMSGYYTISTAEGFLAATEANALEQIADGTADAAVWILLQKAYWEDIVNSTYTVAGTKNLTDTENDWDIDEANQMTYNDETNLYEKKFKRIAIDAENQPEFKVVQTNMAGENIWYPENNWVITTDYVGGEGLYDITITFDPSDFKEIGVIPEKRIVFPENAIVYDFEAAADAGENPANKNGSAANGQAFYGWENPEKTDNKRQDYKGYEWAEGSVLPEVCHVWRRSDRINGNVADNGGLKCPSNKEMAVDGLKAYDKVIIVYDAENATDKEIIWAIGDGTSEGGPGTVRATATIGGVEAVTGETTIASGAEILVKSVTPAENVEDGTGYIVFQVKKGMIIKQIAIVSMNAEWAEAIAAAQALAEEDGVAVGKLLAAIDEAKGISEPTEEQEAALQTAVDQYKLDNADQEKDETAKVATNGWKKFDGSDAGVCQTKFAPAIDTYDGRKNVQLAEVYETTVETTGTIIYQDITGLTNGKYKAGFYGNAFFTSGRGFDSTMEDGATDVAYVFANDQKEFITARIATETTENDFRTFDVEVTDGTIKLGMGKDKAGTNWHTMQIYQLTWFATAKEVYAADQAELTDLVAKAEALVADETKTEGKDALAITLAVAEEAIAGKANWYNITEIEAIIAGLKEAIADFKKANWYIDLTAGEYYIIDVESGLKMAAGHDWGTRGIVNELGLDLTLTPYTESRTVTIDSRVNNNGSHFLGENLYMDSSEWGWALEYQGFGFYILEPNGGKYINLDKDNNLVLSDTPREFIIVTKGGVRAQLLEELSVATKDAPVDATGLITANNFNRFDTRNTDAWIVSVDCTNSNLSGGNNVNNCAESFHSTFTIMQTISDAPAGFYQLTAQGFYRQDDYEGELPAAPVFFANEVNGDVPAKTGSENGMSDASASFTNGLYTIEPITFEVKEDGMMYIGITASTNTQWVIWDNFQLKYFGAENPITVGISNVNVETANNGTIYNLNGQKVDKARKGLYIVNGKKMIVK